MVVFVRILYDLISGELQQMSTGAHSELDVVLHKFCQT
jgi:hypothetical protein